ncbi:ATP-grasp domain-containing protein [Novosphingobium sp. KCTC 2891]|uniref:carboxyl transferase domain-containing protein n=1 Tax=Novosphingobium sp. KCTC 2891 TaxID=2989730 RepID=UPI002222A3F9|nr:carboxyl transferase domain-containing protein [Novosphingobium sp. KCTC 2891]MCW1384950.1 ATP-grasp domain-containing protein [Novosphingobium sp. KCTC 2891]
MTSKVLIANRGEIAIRIARTAAEMGIETLMVFPADDIHSAHVRAGDAAREIAGTGVAAYLDGPALIERALAEGCDLVHPGYGFLSENATFARACAAAGLTFVGPSPDTLDLFGDKAAARALAERCDVPILPGISRAVTLEEAEAFHRALGPGRAIMLKALAGGGGRGMRPVEAPADLAAIYERCASEARQAFGSGALYVEEFFPSARHVEVQIVADGQGNVSHLWDRECSLQRQRQKLVEIAPAFGLAPDLRAAMLDAAVRLAQAADYRGVGTVEFLVDASGASERPFVFIEANPRIQVEHTVTEEVTGIDLVRAQFAIAAGRDLPSLGLAQADIPVPSQVALQARVNLETLTATGEARPTGGIISRYEVPSGRGIRVDGYGHAGYATSPRYDSLLAKVIVAAPDLPAAVAKARRALAEFRIEGVGTNSALLRALLERPEVAAGKVDTRFVERHAAALVAASAEHDSSLAHASAAASSIDPLAVLSAAPRAPGPGASAEADLPDGLEGVRTPMIGTIVAVMVSPGEDVRAGQPLAIIEALKMEHVIASPVSGLIAAVHHAAGDVVGEGVLLAAIAPGEVAAGADHEDAVIDPDATRPDIDRVAHMHRLVSDAGRADAVTRRHAKGKRTARENIADLCDDDSFMEYGPLVTAGRRYEDSPEDVDRRLVKTASDGLVMGIGRINGALFGPEQSRCVAMSYDYTVLAGTQGHKNHVKTDRMLEVAQKMRLPVVFYTEGGGGRSGGTSPGDPTPPPTTVGGLKYRTWAHLGKLSGLVPLVGIASGFCFAGNAVVLALCDVIIATKDSSLGIGGPAMIEGGGLGIYAPEEVGPVSVQGPNGVIDILVEDEAEATAVAKRYLSYFQGRVGTWEAPDQRPLRHAIPENRRAAYDVRKIIATLADKDSVLELRAAFAKSMVTALARIEGRPIGVIANNCASPTGGAVDSDGADKAARFMQLCNAFDIPVVTLIDVPGNMVGPEAERTATIRHCGRLYVIGANLGVPMFSVVLRKAYGLGAMAMTAGSLDSPLFTVAWPTGEFAGMGIEGEIKLGYRAELAAIEDLEARRERYDELLDRAYAWSSAANGATVFEFDDVIDPAGTRDWLKMGLEALPASVVREGKRQPWIDTW